MKRQPKLFIETTVINFYFEGKQGQKRKDGLATPTEVLEYDP